MAYYRDFSVISLHDIMLAVNAAMDVMGEIVW
jgi:hypothetical protein